MARNSSGGLMFSPRFIRGPSANATQAQLDDLAAAGRGDSVPTVVGLSANLAPARF